MTNADDKKQQLIDELRRLATESRRLARENEELVCQFQRVWRELRTLNRIETHTKVTK
jgi:hypothetical protein